MSSTTAPRARACKVTKHVAWGTSGSTHGPGPGTGGGGSGAGGNGGAGVVVLITTL